MKIVVDGQPLPKGRPRSAGVCPRCSCKLPPPHTPKKTREHERKIKTAAMAQGMIQAQGPVAICATFYRADARRVDVDNLAKSATDALNGVAYSDDSQVAAALLVRDIDRDRPRTEIEVVSMERAREVLGLRLERL